MEGARQQKGPGEGACHAGVAAPGDGRGNGMASPEVGGGGGAGTEGAGCCHLGGGEGSRWPDDMGPGGGLRGALLGSWAEPATRGCGGLAAGAGGNLATGGGGNLAATTILTTRPWPPIPFDARGWSFGRLGQCGGLAARGCPCSHAASCRGAPVGGAGWQPEAPGSWWAGAGGGRGEGGVAGSPPRPQQ